MESIRIRVASREDVPSLSDLFIEFHEFHVRGLPRRLRSPERYDLAELRDGILSRIDDALQDILVIELDGRIVGLAEVYLREDEPHPLRVPSRYGYLQSLVVTAECRRRGFGRLLVVASEKWARDRGATEMQIEMWEFEAGPLRFYESCGYTGIRRTVGKQL